MTLVTCVALLATWQAVNGAPESALFDVPSETQRAIVQLGVNYQPLGPFDANTLHVYVDASPKVVKALRQLALAKQRNVVVLHAAIANRTGTTTFHDNKESTGAGLIKPTASVRWKNGFTNSYEVPVMPMSAVAATLPAHFPIEILKTNIEGFDLTALQTLGREYIGRVRLLLSEIDITGLDVYGVQAGYGQISNEIHHFEEYLNTVGFNFLACVAGADNVAVKALSAPVAEGWRAVRHPKAPGALCVHVKEVREVPLDVVLMQDPKVRRREAYHTNFKNERFRYRWLHCVMAPR